MGVQGYLSNAWAHGSRLRTHMLLGLSRSPPGLGDFPYPDPIQYQVY